MKRAGAIALASLFVLLGGLTTFGSTIRVRSEMLRGVVDATRSGPLPLRMPRLGVNADLTIYGRDLLLQQIGQMQAMHVRWIRQFFRWDVVAREDGGLDWSAYDTLIETLDTFHDIELIAVLFGAPSWEGDPRATSTATAPPASPEAFSVFAGEFAARYGDVIDVYQIWDEPNLGAAWGGLSPQPADYLALLDAAYRSIHSADPDAAVVAAALAPTTEQTEDNLSDWAYLEALYHLGGASSFDAAAGKPYGFSYAPEDRVVHQDRLNFSRVIGLREIMEAHGDAGKPLWLSNFGWNTLPQSWQGDPSIWGQVTAEQQIDYTVQAIQRIDQEWAWAGGAILQLWEPDAPCDDPEWGFALKECGDTSKQTSLYHALAERSQSDIAAKPGLHSPLTPYTVYRGVWTFSPLGADIGWIHDSRLTFTFEGRDIALLLREDDYVAFLHAWIDGMPANALPRDSEGRAFVNLTSSTRSPETNLVLLATNLSDGPHSLEIVADGGWDRWALAGFAVGAGDQGAPYDQQIGVALLTTLIGALGFTLGIAQLGFSKITHCFSHRIPALQTTQRTLISFISSLGVTIGMLLTFGDGVPSILRREPAQITLAILTAGIVYLQPHVILLAVSLLLLSILLYQQPQVGLLLTLFYAPLFLFPVELYQFAFPMSELVILLTTTLTALRVFVQWSKARRSPSMAGTSKVRLNALDAALVVWLALALISVSWAAYPTRAMTDLRVIFVEPLLFYALFRVYGRERRFLQVAAIVLVTAGIVVAGIGLFLYVGGQAVITAEGGVQRMASVYGSPNNAALFLGRCIPFALSFALITDRRRNRLAAGFALALMLAALILTQSAGALLLGLPASTILVILLMMRRRGWLVIGGIGMLGVTAFSVALNSARFQRLLDFTQGTNFFRLRVWESAVNMITDHPITGLGLDQFLYAYRNRYLQPDAWQEPNLSHPHNFLLDIWLRLGIAGPLVFLVLQAVYWRSAVRLIQALRRTDGMSYALVVGAAGCMVGLLAHGIVDNSIFVNDLSYVFVLLVGMISNLRAVNASSVPEA